MKADIAAFFRKKFALSQKEASSSVPRDFRVVALLTARNEEMYIGHCIRHLISQGVDILVIDNDSTDQTAEIARSFVGDGVIAVNRYPYPGYYDWRGILQDKEKLSYEIDADWFIHHDADEIREAPHPYRSLKEAIQDVDAGGYNAIDFDEFVFLPTEEKESFEGKDYVEEMKYYYFFRPAAGRRINAWKKTHPVNLTGSGGHSIEFGNRHLFERNFILRHYLALSKKHLEHKYIQRKYSVDELRDGWHRVRATLTSDLLRLPGKDELHLYRGDGIWDMSSPRTQHCFVKE